MTRAVFVAALIFGVLTAGDVPASDDARFYVRAAVNHGRWLESALSLDAAAWSRRGVDAAFSQNSEHPSVAKFAMGATWLVLHRWTGWLSELAACRAAIILLWALMATAVFAFTRPVTSVAPALFAAVALTAMPRLLYHAHAETLDLPVSALITLTALMLWRCLESPRWRTGIAAVGLFGLALGTKLNAPFMLVAAGVYWLLLNRPRFTEGRWLNIKPVPLVFLGLATVSPLLMFLTWPWIWFDTFNRLNKYALFHLDHYGILYYFSGTLYGDEVAPWYAPSVMAALTIPVPLLMLLLLGAYRPALRGLAAVFSRADQSPTHGDRLHRLELFVLLQALVQLAIVSLPTSPKYGGIKLFLPAFPFFAVLMGCAFHRITIELARLAAGRRFALVTAATAAILLMPGWLGAAQHRGAWLTYYNTLAGGLRGATESGYERQYYDLGYREMARALREHLPNGGSVAVLPNPKEYTPHLSRWQLNQQVPLTVRLAPPERADVLVLTHERRWSNYPELMARYRTKPLLYRYQIAGVPLFSVYKLR